MSSTLFSFRYEGRNGQGIAQTGTLFAQNQDEAARLLFQQGITPLRIERGGGESRALRWHRGVLQRRVPLPILVMFCRQFFSLTKAGIPLLRAVKGLAQSCRDPLLVSALQAISADLTNGTALSVAMKPHTKVFPTLFIAMIHVGENTGRLDQSLSQLADYYEQEMMTRRRVRSAMRYPSFVLLALLLAMTILNLKVIPQFTHIFARFDVALPWATRTLIATSDFFVNYWWGLVLGAVLTGVGFHFWRRSVAGRLQWDRLTLHFPIMGSIVHRALLSRFSHTFSLMLKAGVPLHQALQMSADALDNAYLEQRLLMMKQGIEAGYSISIMAEQTTIFTPLVLQMISVGEETGRVDALLLEVADFYDREVDYELQTLTARIEPILLTIVAGMVLLMAMGIFLPMWNMLDAIQ